MRKRSACEHFSQRDTSHILHHDVGRALLLAQVVDRDDIRMVERRGRAGFLLEAPQPFRVVGELRAKHFYDDMAVELEIFGFVDLAHTPGPNGREDFHRGPDELRGLEAPP